MNIKETERIDRLMEVLTGLLWEAKEIRREQQNYKNEIRELRQENESIKQAFTKIKQTNGKMQKEIKVYERWNNSRKIKKEITL